MKTMGELKDEKDRLERETRTRRQLETALKVNKTKNQAVGRSVAG